MNYRSFKKMNIENIGKNMRKVREGNTVLTQEELARKCGLTSKSISEIELGKTIPSIANIEKICKALNIRLEDILY